MYGTGFRRACVPQGLPGRSNGLKLVFLNAWCRERFYVHLL